MDLVSGLAGRLDAPRSHHLSGADALRVSILQATEEPEVLRTNRSNRIVEGQPVLMDLPASPSVWFQLSWSCK